MSVNYLMVEDIREIHEVAIERYGGLPGEHEPGLIEFMAEKPSMEAYGTELYPGLFMKAAVYMEGFSRKQLFADGNKRTAYICAATFLELNGYQVMVDDEELYQFSIYVANGNGSLEDIARWLESVSVPV